MNEGIYEELVTQLVSDNPMSIEWELKKPVPHYLWERCSKVES